MPKSPQRLAKDEELFIVRIRRDGELGPSLRGYVDEVRSSQRFYFTSVSDLNAFFERHIAAARLEGKRP